MHEANGSLNLSVGEGDAEVIQQERPLRVEVIQSERPSDFLNTPRAVIKQVQDVCFLIVAGAFTAFVLNHLYPVLAPLLVSTSMEVARVLVTTNSSPNFTLLFPDHQLGPSGSAKKAR